MSTVCMFVISTINSTTINITKNKISDFAKSNNRGVTFCVDWQEPLLSAFTDEELVVSLKDSPNNTNCEMMLLPDNWYINGLTNSSPFSERAKFLKAIASIILEIVNSVDLYIFTSGTPAEELIKTTSKCECLVKCLVETVGEYGPDMGLHIVVRS